MAMNAEIHVGACRHSFQGWKGIISTHPTCDPRSTLFATSAHLVSTRSSWNRCFHPSAPWLQVRR